MILGANFEKAVSGEFDALLRAASLRCPHFTTLLLPPAGEGLCGLKESAATDNTLLKSYKMNVRVKTQPHVVSLSVEPTHTVGDVLSQVLAMQNMEQLPDGQQRLFLGDALLENKRTLADIGIEDGVAKPQQLQLQDSARVHPAHCHTPPLLTVDHHRAAVRLTVRFLSIPTTRMTLRRWWRCLQVQGLFPRRRGGLSQPCCALLVSAAQKLSCLLSIAIPRFFQIRCFCV